MQISNTILYKSLRKSRPSNANSQIYIPHTDIQAQIRQISNEAGIKRGTVNGWFCVLF